MSERENTIRIEILAWALGGDVRALGLRRAIAGRQLIERWFAEKGAAAAAYV